MFLRMIKQWRKIIGAGALLFFYSLPLLAKPGNEVLLEQKQLDVVLYVVGVSVSGDSQLKGIQLAWIPESMRGKYPPKILSTWISQADSDPINKKVFDELSQLKLIQDILLSCSGGETEFSISEDKKFRAKILYIKFSNGQNFQVIDIWDKSF